MADGGDYGGIIQMYYGTGTPPSAGNSTTGTSIGSPSYNQGHDAFPAQLTPFTCQSIVSGLSVGTVYWFDCSLASYTGGTNALNAGGVDYVIIEL